ncbi:hypothetical protein V8D89_012951 [Ganoderma adspersum]
MASHDNNLPISTHSEIAHAVPPEERDHLPNNEPAPLDHQQGHIQINAGDIESDLWEVLQKPYEKGSGKEKGAGLRIPFFPSGFTAATVLSGKLNEVVDVNGDIPTLEGQSWPKKTAFYFEFCDAAYNTPVQLAQRRVSAPLTRGRLATHAAEEIEKMLVKLPQFPYTLAQIKVLSIDIRSRGTVQARIFVTSEGNAQAQA